MWCMKSWQPWWRFQRVTSTLSSPWRQYFPPFLSSCQLISSRLVYSCDAWRLSIWRQPTRKACPFTRLPSTSFARGHGWHQDKEAQGLPSVLVCTNSIVSQWHIGKIWNMIAALKTDYPARNQQNVVLTCTVIFSTDFSSGITWFHKPANLLIIIHVVHTKNTTERHEKPTCPVCICHFLILVYYSVIGFPLFILCSILYNLFLMQVKLSY